MQGRRGARRRARPPPTPTWSRCARYRRSGERRLVEATRDAAEHRPHRAPEARVPAPDPRPHRLQREHGRARHVHRRCGRRPVGDALGEVVGRGAGLGSRPHRPRRRGARRSVGREPGDLPAHGHPPAAPRRPGDRAQPPVPRDPARDDGTAPGDHAPGRVHVRRGDGARRRVRGPGARRRRRRVARGSGR